MAGFLLPHVLPHSWDDLHGGFYSDQDRKIYGRLFISRPDGQTWEELTSYLVSARINVGDVAAIGTGQSGADSVVRQAEFTLINNRQSKNSLINALLYDADGNGLADSWVAGNAGTLLCSQNEQTFTATAQYGVIYQEIDLGASGATGPWAFSVELRGLAGRLVVYLYDAANTYLGAVSSSSATDDTGFKRFTIATSRTDVRKISFRIEDNRASGWTPISFRYPQVEIGKSVASDFVVSLHPRDRNSSYNQVGNVYTPLLWPGREVILDVAAVPINQEPAAGDWIRVFRGYMGDSIQASSDNGRINIQCRDQAKRLQDCYIETARTYGSGAGTPAETVIQQIIDDNLGAGAVSLYAPVSPGFMITPYNVEFQTVWDAIQEIAKQIGWYLGYRYWPELNDFRLALMPPPRTKDSSSADFTLDWTKDLEIQELDITDRDVRNVIKVTYRNASTGLRDSVTVTDSASIAEYGRRAMQIEEADTSLIDTATEATALANAALWDLKDLTATTRITMPFIPTMDVFSGILVTNPRLSSTQDFYAVESVEHTLDWESGRFRTEIVGAGRVVGAHNKWLAMQTRPGAVEPVRTGNIAPAAIITDRIALGSAFTIHQTGIMTVPANGSVTVNFPALSYRPASLAYFLSTREPTANQAVLIYYVYFENPTAYSWGAWVSTTANSVTIFNYYNWEVSFRYYVFREEGI